MIWNYILEAIRCSSAAFPFPDCFLFRTVRLQRPGISLWLIARPKTDGKLQFFLANKLCQFSRSRLVPHCWPFPCFLGQYHNAVYANYIGPSVMTDANSEGFPMWWKNYLKIKLPMCHKNWHTLQSRPKIIPIRRDISMWISFPVSVSDCTFNHANRTSWVFICERY